MIGIVSHVDPDSHLVCEKCNRVYASEEAFVQHHITIVHGGIVAYYCQPTSGNANTGITINACGVWEAEIDLSAPNFVGGPLPTEEDSQVIKERICSYMAGAPESERMEGAI